MYMEYMYIRYADIHSIGRYTVLDLRSSGQVSPRSPIVRNGMDHSPAVVLWDSPQNNAGEQISFGPLPAILGDGPDPETYCYVGNSGFLTTSLKFRVCDLSSLNVTRFNLCPRLMTLPHTSTYMQIFQ